MKCPNCKETILVMSQRQGVEIDYCPDCRGVWLDRGELDKILEKESSLTMQAQGARQQSHGQGHPHPHPQSYHPYPKRKSWLQDIFD
ncbi:MAG: zf-TFIIB domain-containing protein [Rhodoferax sp.]|nr:zf-TFIIB domain-containing protein [Rhodoferax sp.]